MVASAEAAQQPARLTSGRTVRLALEQVRGDSREERERGAKVNRRDEASDEGKEQRAEVKERC